MHIALMAREGARGRAYQPPRSVGCTDLKALVQESRRSIVADKQLHLLRSGGGADAAVWWSGDPSLLKSRTVSIVGTREASDCGWLRAARLARELAGANVVIMSGLAKGIDTAALTSAIRGGGRVVAVIGTPLSKAYPAENASLQQEIYNQHLLISPFHEGEPVFRSNFPKRNRVMALLSDATVIVEASDTSGTLHQAAECLRQDRWLFILKSVVDDQRLTWPAKFLGKPKVAVLESTEDILQALG